MSTKIKGIDISVYQGNPDFKALKNAGVQFIILRAGLGKVAKQVDKKFESNYAGAKAAGIPVGVYWYSYATTVAEAEQEAKACLQVIKGKQFEYPIWYDIEEKKTFATGKQNVSAIADTFCKYMESKGYFAGIYMSASPATSYLTDAVANRYAMWIAQYTSTCKYKRQYGMWQYSAKGYYKGIKGDVDSDFSYCDYESIIKEKGLNGFPKPEKPVLLGDVNQDGTVDPTDASIVLNEYTNTTVMGNPSTLTADQKKAADVNKDGKIDPTDATQIMTQYANDIIKE